MRVWELRRASCCWCRRAMTSPGDGGCAMVRQALAPAHKAAGPAPARLPDGQPDFRACGMVARLALRMPSSNQSTELQAESGGAGRASSWIRPTGNSYQRGGGQAKLILENHTDPTPQSRSQARCMLHGVPHRNIREFQIFQPAGTVIEYGPLCLATFR